MTYKKIILGFILTYFFVSFFALGRLSAAPKQYMVIKEAFKTYWNDDDNIDSPAFWQSPDGMTNYLIATSKAKHNLFLFNAENGRFIKTIGREGVGNLEFNRPNGIWVIDNLLLVCERDNKRIQVISLPEFVSIGFIGDGILRRPYGLSVYKQDNSYKMFVTDQYEADDESYLPLNQLNERVKSFSFEITNRKLKWNHIKSFGDTSGAGLLFIVESIYADPLNNNILIAEEDKNQNIIKVYDLNGNFKNLIVGKKQFEYQAEGIALFDCGNGEGYWFCTDQDFYKTGNNTIHIYDRKSLNYITSFITGRTDNTDGIWLTQNSFGNFQKGALFCVDDDGGVGVFDLAKILETLNLKCN